jgi:uncharacterized protein (TIGR02757 family)
VQRASIDDVRRALDAVEARCDMATRREADPVAFVHRYADLHDKEIVALVASSLAFGNAKVLRTKIADALARLGPSPASFADDAARVERALTGFRHRIWSGRHVARLVVGARRVQARASGLGAALASALDDAGGDLVGALVRWTDAIRSAGGLSRMRGTGARHLLPRPDGGGANKRLMLLLRWMSRPADGIDLGLWPIPTEQLVIPLDVHLHKLGKNLGFTQSKAASWKAALEVTAALRRLDAKDPVRYDFSLCHLGMVQQCPSRRDEARCEGCGVKPVCVHWAGRRGPRSG